MITISKLSGFNLVSAVDVGLLPRDDYDPTISTSRSPTDGWHSIVMFTVGRLTHTLIRDSGQVPTLIRNYIKHVIRLYYDTLQDSSKWDIVVKNDTLNNMAYVAEVYICSDIADEIDSKIEDFLKLSKLNQIAVSRNLDL